MICLDTVTQRAHNRDVKMTSMRRKGRRIDACKTSFRRHVPAGQIALPRVQSDLGLHHFGNFSPISIYLGTCLFGQFGR